ncbi:MAG: bifunctional phosphoribosylaminoimidazolecarboxamide formyltransferase/IMP cyclohydrolase [Pseudomonadota bacterium]
MSIQSKNIPAPDRVPVRRALISVFDKTGILDLAKTLAGYGVELVSTGGTAKAIADAGLPVRDVSELTNFPEVMDGRVKTLHPGVHGGLLAIRDDEDHVNAMEAHHIAAIDLLVSNLYPFEETVRSGASWNDAVENIDIGGPAMVRAAAKNHAYVTVLTSPDDYAEFETMLSEHDGATTLDLRKRLAQRAYARTASYDAAVSNHLAKELGVEPERSFAIGGTLATEMRYGENPHQNAGFYANGDPRPAAATATVLQGKQLSYNNINDTDAAFELVAEFPSERPAIAIIKHANPCGVATGETLLEAHQKALACDSVSAFGGIIAANTEIDAASAEAIINVFSEVIIAPSISDEAKAIFAAKKNLRLLETGGMPDPAAPGIFTKTVAGGMLVQNRDNGAISADDLNCVTKIKPTEQELADLLFAWKVAKHVKSNAIVYVKDQATVGIGAGQMSRVDSALIAARKAQDAADASGADQPATIGSVVASDAFFPFADGLLSAIEAGAKAVVQPGGSMRDKEVIAAADEAGISMVFTGMRHFRH